MNIKLLIIVIFLSGCVLSVQPEVDQLEFETSESLAIDHIILSKNVVLQRGKATSDLYASEKLIDVTGTSKFGKEHDVANVDCIVDGLQDVLKESDIISPNEFWASLGKDTLSLPTLLNEDYLLVKNKLNLDFLIIAYHQLILVDKSFMEALAEGAITSTERETATTIILDMKNKKIIDAVELNADYYKSFMHVIVIIPLVLYQYPEEDLCYLSGKYAAESILKLHPQNTHPRIAVVASKYDPYGGLSTKPYPLQPDDD